MTTAETNAAEAFAGESGTVPAVTFSETAPTNAVITNSTITSKFYTEEDLARVRSQEKEKLYPQIETLKEEVATLKKIKEEETARLAAEAEEKAKALAEAEKAKMEEELSAKDLLKAKEQEWAAQLEQERQERANAFALLEKEKEFAALSAYKAQRIDAERDNIIPELVDLINGSTPDELDENINALKERSARILESVQQASQSARREMTGTRPTLPAAGPLETNSDQRSFTAQDIASMSMDEYAKYRQRLLSPSALGRSQGLFG